MGGQACILYGGAEFSRDIDIAVDPDAENLEAVREALERLEAERVFVPDLDRSALIRGHACHFRARAPGAEGTRIDMMSKMRGCGPFDELWEKRSIVDLQGIGEVPVLSLSDLVRAKKTQREKDWPMIRRLIEADVIQNAGTPSPNRIAFWLQECRTARLLEEFARRHPQACERVAVNRPLLNHALAADRESLLVGLEEEERREREADAEYWRPLRKELEQMLRERRRSSGSNPEIRRDNPLVG